MTEQDKILYCQVVAQIIIADAAVTDDERDFLERLMDHLGLGPDGKKAVLNGVDYGDPVEDKVAKIDPELRQYLVKELEVAAGSDGNVDKRESALIESVRAALFFSS